MKSDVVDFSGTVGWGSTAGGGEVYDSGSHEQGCEEELHACCCWIEGTTGKGKQLEDENEKQAQLMLSLIELLMKC